jgi:hypothetical protein
MDSSCIDHALKTSREKKYLVILFLSLCEQDHDDQDELEEDENDQDENDKEDEDDFSFTYASFLPRTLVSLLCEAFREIKHGNCASGANVEISFSDTSTCYNPREAQK